MIKPETKAEAKPEIKPETKPEIKANLTASAPTATPNVPAEDEKKATALPGATVATLAPPAPSTPPTSVDRLDYLPAGLPGCLRCPWREKWLDRSAETVSNQRKRIEDLMAEVAKWKMAYAELHLAQQTTSKPANPSAIETKSENPVTTADPHTKVNGQNDSMVSRRRIKREKMVPLNKRQDEEDEEDEEETRAFLKRVWWDHKYGYQTRYAMIYSYDEVSPHILYYRSK